MNKRQIIFSPVFKTWLASLKDSATRKQIIRRIVRLENGNLGDSKPVGEGVSEYRIHLGPGYRLYYVQEGDVVIILLCAGTKRTQTTDIARAMKMKDELK